MDTAELKSMIHESVENIADQKFLLLIKELADRKYQALSSPNLTKSQISRIDDSKNQIADGKYLENDEADKIADKWLNG